jgi:hypothetical protein
MEPVGWPEVIIVALVIIAMVWIIRRIRDDPGRRPVYIGGAAVVGLLLAAGLYNSGSATSLAGVPTTFECDGSTHTDDHLDRGIPACAQWDLVILRDDLEYPEGIEAADIDRLESEQALWGYWDRCTATSHADSTSWEQVVPCW